MDRPDENPAQENPQPSRNETVKNGHGRAEDRAGAGDRGKMMGENDGDFRRDEVAVVPQSDGRGRPGGILAQAAGDEAGIEAAGQNKDGGGGDQDGQNVHDGLQRRLL